MQKILLFAVLMLVLNQVHAQQQLSERKGLIIGVSAGIAVASISGDTPNISDGAAISLPNLKLGWMYNQNLAILISSPGITYSRGKYDRSLDGIIPSIQLWVKPGWWVSGGFGVGMDTATIYDSKSSNDDTNFGTACQLSSGYEIYKKGRFTIDVQGTLFAANINTDWGEQETVSFFTGFGFNFY